MKKILSITAVLLCATFASCNKDTADDAAQGAVTFSLGVESDVPDIITRAEGGLTLDELKNTAVIKIYKGDFSGQVREYVNSDKPETIYLQAGDYRVDVEAGQIIQKEPKPASWDYRSFKGSKEFSINKNETTSVSVVAKICNVVTNVLFDDSIHDSFGDSYSLVIGLSETDPAQQLTYTPAQQGRNGYFITDGFEPSLYWTFTGTLADGTPFEKSDEIPAVEQGKCYRMNLKYTEKNGKLEFSLMVDKTTEDHEDEIIFEPVSTGLSSSSIYEIWAAHATVHADVDNSYDTDKTYFEYRTAGAGEWTRAQAMPDTNIEGSFYADLKGLAPNTKYEYRLVVTTTAGDEETIEQTKEFTTEKAVAIPNGSFEETSNDESDKYKSFYNPASAIEENRTMWWGSGNKGSVSAGAKYVITYPDSNDKKDGAQSVCLASVNAIIKFAAGNIFSGHYGDTILGLTQSGGTVYFGRPFTARPTALRFWAKYSTDLVTHAGGPAGQELKKDVDYDMSQIKIALGTWDYRKYGGDKDSPVLVNTTKEETFIDYNTDQSTIAYGEVVLKGDAENSTNVWQQITIPLDYKNENTYPTHIIISCAASIFGDYFAGCENSKLWLDGMELLYE